MNPETPHKVALEIIKYKLTQTEIENLASEFMGKILAPLNLERGATLELEFSDKEYSVEYNTASPSFSGAFLAKEFLRTLDAFKIQ